MAGISGYAGNGWAWFEMGWRYYSFEDLGSIRYESWGIGGFQIGSCTIKSPGLFISNSN